MCFSLLEELWIQVYVLLLLLLCSIIVQYSTAQCSVV